jgi:hypothetical protein
MSPAEKNFTIPLMASELKSDSTPQILSFTKSDHQIDENNENHSITKKPHQETSKTVSRKGTAFGSKPQSKASIQGLTATSDSFQPARETEDANKHDSTPFQIFPVFCSPHSVTAILQLNISGILLSAFCCRNIRIEYFFP